MELPFRDRMWGSGPGPEVSGAGCRVPVAWRLFPPGAGHGRVLVAVLLLLPAWSGAGRAQDEGGAGLPAGVQIIEPPPDTVTPFIPPPPADAGGGPPDAGAGPGPAAPGSPPPPGPAGSFPPAGALPPPAPGDAAPGTASPPVRPAPTSRIPRSALEPLAAAHDLGRDLFESTLTSINRRSCASCHSVAALSRAARDYPRFHPLMHDVATLPEAIQHCASRWMQGWLLAPGSQHSIALTVYLRGLGAGGGTIDGR